MTKSSLIDTNWTPVRMIDAPKRRNLVIVRTGKQSIHTEWDKNLKGADRNWDLLLSHYGAGEPSCPDAEIIVRQGAFKYPACHRLFADIAWLNNYSAVWFCDDDILTSWANINAMFDLFHHYELTLAQPSLTPDSYFSHQITLQKPEYLLRFTNFVEIMVPILSNRALPTCLPTMENVVTAWGLDWVWPHLLQCARHKIAMIDATPVRHTRPVFQGEMYLDIDKKVGINPNDEMAGTLRRYGATMQQLIHGYLTLHPQEFGARTLASLSPAVAAQQDKVTALLSPPAPAKVTKLPNWQTPANIAAVPHDIPALSDQDYAMGFGMQLNLQPLTGNAIEVLQIGAERNQARVLIDAHPEGAEHYRLTLRLFSADNTSVHMPLPPLIPANMLATFKIQLVPCTGHVKIWFDDKVVEQGLLPPWHWVSVNRLWLGSKRLKGAILNSWLSPASIG